MAASEELLFLDLRLTDASALCDWALPGIVPVFWGDRLVGCLLFQGGWLNYISTTIRAYPSDGANPRITHTIPHNLGGLLGKLRSGLNQTMLITIRKRGDVIHKHYSHYSKHQCPMTKAPQTHNLSQSGYSMYNDLTATWLGNCLDWGTVALFILITCFFFRFLYFVHTNRILKLIGILTHAPY